MKIIKEYTYNLSKFHQGLNRDRGNGMKNFRSSIDLLSEYFTTNGDNSWTIKVGDKFLKFNFESIHNQILVRLINYMSNSLTEIA
jgi:hypothetical protein